jgi:hypothetical protein
MIYIDKNTIPHCYVVEEKFEWGEPYTVKTPIFNLSIDPDLSDIEFTIEILGKNNFKTNLEKLYNILLNKEENYRIDNFNETILNREFLIQKIINFIDENANNIAPWENEYDIIGEVYHLKMIEHDLQRKILFEKNIY